MYNTIKTLSAAAYADAKAHGLYDDVNLCLEKRSIEFVRKRLTLLIREEVCEMWDAHQEPDHFAEEMADVMIMCMSASAHLGIDLESQILRKMEVNRKRPYGHKTA